MTKHHSFDGDFDLYRMVPDRVKVILYDAHPFNMLIKWIRFVYGIFCGDQIRFFCAKGICRLSARSPYPLNACLFLFWSQ